MGKHWQFLAVIHMRTIDLYKKCLTKVAYMEERLGHQFPHITNNGIWLTNANGHWTGGFWVGLLWLDYLYTRDSSKQLRAEKQAMRLAARMSDNKTHDMGFIFGPSCILGHNIEPNKRLVNMAIVGGHNMATLFEEKVGLVLAWDEPGHEGLAIVDSIMNAPIMIWAAKQEQNHKLHETGVALANNIRKQHVRSDYSTYHTVRWDVDNFQIVERSTHQGYAPDSCWSRGQAWALYGFANMYRYAGDKENLEISQKLSDYFWNHLEQGLCLPKWDFSLKDNVKEPIDAAAASIASSGMLLLSKMLAKTNRYDRAEVWKTRGKKIIDSLANYCLFENFDNYGLINKVTVDKPRNSGIYESSTYGDYYFMEALYRYMNYDQDDRLDLLF